MVIHEDSPFDADRKAHDKYAVWLFPSLSDRGKYLEVPDWQYHILGASVRDEKRPMMGKMVEAMRGSLKMEPYNSIGVGHFSDFGVMGPVGRLYGVQAGGRRGHAESEMMIRSMEALAKELEGQTVGLSWPRGFGSTREAIEWVKDEQIFAPGSAVYLPGRLIGFDEAMKLWSEECKRLKLDPEQCKITLLYPDLSIDRQIFDRQLLMASIHYQNSGYTGYETPKIGLKG